MILYLGTTVLCRDDQRSASGTPVGPSDLVFSETPGVEIREFIGKDRVEPEAIRCSHGTITFKATRIYASVSAATAYALVGQLSEAVSGVLKYGTTTIFAKACVTARRVVQVGRTVIVNYTIEG